MVTKLVLKKISISGWFSAKREISCGRSNWVTLYNDVSFVNIG